jgi:hypothetical protein
MGRPVESDFRSAVLELAVQYFDAYPGVTVDDFRRWGGWSVAQLQHLEEELEYCRLAADAKPLEDAWAGWHLLPPLDALTMAYQGSDTWLAPEYRAWVFDAAGNSTSVILHDGRCVGLWDMIEVEDVLHEARVAFFDGHQHVSFELERVFRTLSKFLGLEVENVVQVRPERTLQEAGPSVYRSPLKDAVFE